MSEKPLVDVSGWNFEVGPLAEQLIQAFAQDVVNVFANEIIEFSADIGPEITFRESGATLAMQMVEDSDFMLVWSLSSIEPQYPSDLYDESDIANLKAAAIGVDEAIATLTEWLERLHEEKAAIAEVIASPPAPDSR